MRALLDVQQVDLARDRLNERKEHLPLKADLADLEVRVAEVQAAIDRVDAEARSVDHEIRELEEGIRLLDEKIAAEEGKLYGGEVVNPKELSALQSEIEMLRRRRTPMEEGELERLQARDDLATERQRLEQEKADLGREADALRTKIDAAIGEIDAELAREDSKRDGLVARISTDTLELYEELRGSKRGVGVGALEGGICTACREALSAMEVDRIKRQAREGERLHRCEHCRRLLVVP
jgi:hypothetical protein